MESGVGVYSTHKKGNSAYDLIHISSEEEYKTLSQKIHIGKKRF